VDARIENGNLVVTIALIPAEDRELSSTGKTIGIAKATGARTALVVDGKPVSLNLQAWIRI